MPLRYAPNVDGPASSSHSVGRYSIYREIASGGMATVYLGRLNAAGGVSRIVAIKRLHPQFCKDPEFVDMFLDEARLAARIHHPNVVPTLDVLADEGELFVVMDYVRGESFSKLWRTVRAQGERIPIPFVTSIVGGMLLGLHAAHGATDEQGHDLGIVHRDVSPQNVIVGEDGTARVLDFGVAKAASRLHQTKDGQLKGKLGYMAPEQISDAAVTKQCDIYAAGIVLWEALAGEYLFRGQSDGETLSRLLARDVAPPSKHNPEVDADLDAVTLKALATAPADRFATARAMAEALEEAARGASALAVGEWVQTIAATTLESRHQIVRDIESGCVDSLSGFPDIRGEALRGSAPEYAPESGTRGQLGTAVTVRSGLGTRITSRRGKRWPLLIGLGLAVGVGGGLLMSDHIARWFGVAPATLATAGHSAAPPAADPSGPPLDTPPAAGPTPTGTSSALRPDVEPSASAAAVPSGSLPAPTARRQVLPPRPRQDKSGHDLDDLDRLIETRK